MFCSNNMTCVLSTLHFLCSRVFAIKHAIVCPLFGSCFSYPFGTTPHYYATSLFDGSCAWLSLVGVLSHGDSIRINIKANGISSCMPRFLYVLMEHMPGTGIPFNIGLMVWRTCCPSCTVCDLVCSLCSPLQIAVQYNCMCILLWWLLFAGCRQTCDM